MSNRIASLQSIRTIGIRAVVGLCAMLAVSTLVWAAPLREENCEQDGSRLDHPSEALRGAAGEPLPITEPLDALHVTLEELTTTVLGRLDEVESLADRLFNQRTIAAMASATLTEAEKDVERARIAVIEYKEGTFQQNLVEAKHMVELAQSELAHAEERFKQIDDLHKQEAVSDEQHTATALWLQGARFELERAQLRLEVLEKLEKDRRIWELETEAARAETIRLTKRVAYKSEEAKVKQLERQSTWMRPTDLDARVVDRLREAAQLLDQLDSIAEADDDGEPLADQVQAHLDEARRLWQRSEAQRARWRLEARQL